MGVSKAFTREDSEVVEASPVRRGVPVPEPNFLTADGARALRLELDALVRDAGDPARIHELTDHLRTAQLVEPAATDRVTFGSRVTVEDDDGARTTYHLVGAIEASPRAHAINWQSPLARALLGARIGDRVTLPRGEVEVIAIA